jgi:hypothetical protein
VTGNPTPADDEPFPNGIVAAIDEAAAVAGGGVHYLLTSAVIVETDRIRPDLLALVASRSRTFHWRNEGPSMRDRMISLIEEHGVVAHVRVRATSRRGQVRARRELLGGLARDLAREGIAHLAIESQGGREDGRDRAVLLDTFRESGGVPFTYDWRTKAEPVLWIADAIGGSCREHLVGQNSARHDRLVANGVIDGLTYP